MMEPKELPYSVFCMSEYDALKNVLVCPPRYMTIKEAINETQKHFLQDNIDQEKAVEQHRLFVKALINSGAEVHELPPSELYPEQVFTRDIGFTIDDTVFISHMGTDMRQGEQGPLIDWLEANGAKYEVISSFAIEGGDVVVDGDTVWVGVSHRTTQKAIDELRRKLPLKKVVPLPFDDQFLHLDCLFNVISPNEALIYSPAFSKEDVEKLASRYTLYEISEEEQFTMGPNVLSLGNKRVLSLPVNSRVNETLRRAGYDVVEVDISEIIKSGGSFRCCSMPIERETKPQQTL